MHPRLYELFLNLRNPRSKSFWLLVFVLVYSAAGFWLLPWLIKDQLPSLARDYIDREASVAEVRFNPWSLELTAAGLEIQDERSAPLLQLDQLYVNLQVSSLFYRALRFRDISLMGPDIRITRYASGDSNLALLIDDYNAAAASAPQEEASEDSEPLRLIVDRLGIDDGRVGLTDQVPDQGFETELTPININVQNLSTLPNEQGEQIIMVNLDGGSQIALAGSLQLNPLLASGSLEVVGSPVPTVERYLDDQLSFKLRDRAFTTSFKFAIREAADQSISAVVQDLYIEMEDITAESHDGEQRYFSIPELSVSGGKITWPGQSVRIDEVRIREPQVNVEIAPDGSLNLAALAPAGAQEESAEPEAAAATATDTVTAEVDTAATEWRVEVDALQVDQLSAAIRDLSLAEPGEISIASLNLLVNSITTQPDKTGTFELDTSLASGGRLEAAGSFVALPELSAAANLALSELALSAVQPWAANAAKVVINDGLLGATGTIEVSSAETLGWQGDVQLTNLDVSDAAENETLAGVKILAVNESRLSLSNNELEISSIDVNAPFARVIINADATTNFGNLANDDATEAPESAAEAGGEALVIKVGQTTVQDGSVDFADFSLPLPFRALITEFGGTVSAIASNSVQPSVVDFDGKVGDYGLANIDGSVSVVDPTNQTEIEMLFRNVSMPDLTPYTVDFAGRAIEDGKLDLDLIYTFNDNRMIGNNKIVLTTFKLGEKIESENAMSLPLDIAVALLKDVNGVIDLNLKVEGDLDDPSFSIGGIVLKALANLIVKAAAAPFKLLGALVPGLGDEEDIGSLRFAAGEAALLPPEREKLDGLATALAQRPNLALKVPGGYAESADARALRAAAVEALLAAEVDGSADDGQLTERTRKALERLARDQLPDVRLRDYREQFEVTDAATGDTNFDEVAYIAALRAQLEARQVIDNARLTELALLRQSTVVEYLLANEAIAAERVVPDEIVAADVEDDRWIKVELSIDVGAAPAAQSSDETSDEASDTSAPNVDTDALPAAAAPTNAPM